jgi:hypothetical protein
MLGLAAGLAESAAGSAARGASSRAGIYSTLNVVIIAASEFVPVEHRGSRDCGMRCNRRSNLAGRPADGFRVTRCRRGNDAE